MTSPFASGGARLSVTAKRLKLRLFSRAFKKAAGAWHGPGGVHLASWEIIVRFRRQPGPGNRRLAEIRLDGSRRAPARRGNSNGRFG